MKTALMTKRKMSKQSIHKKDCLTNLEIVMKSFKVISPFWPLKNLIAVNPLQGFEDLPIEQALNAGASYFQKSELPKSMEPVNLETIKWLQAYFDDGQATIQMPHRKQGLYSAWRQLIQYDVKLHSHNKQKQEWLCALPSTSERAIDQCLDYLNIKFEESEQFLTLLLTTLPGWSGYIKYRTEWAGLDVNHPYPVCQSDYVAMRLIITCLLWPQAKALLDWHAKSCARVEQTTGLLEKIQKTENTYRLPLLKKIAKQPLQASRTPQAQLVFCIDVRSEPFRKSLEAQGDYETFGFAGFFGIPAQITDVITGESYASCPVLLTPQHNIKESPCSRRECSNDLRGYEIITGVKRLYQSVKFTFTTPFALVEGLGIMSGLWMGFRTFAPRVSNFLKTFVIEAIRRPQNVEPSLDSINFDEQCTYAEAALRMIGLKVNFAPIVVFCGHGSSTQNNAYATALDCGACGGRHGASNARILAAILNRPEVRRKLSLNGINIPQTTLFIAAEHNTTTDEVFLYGHYNEEKIQNLKQDLEKARTTNSLTRLQKMGKKTKISNAASLTALRSQDWAQVRPEWGLARNAAFIVGPRDITASLNLEGRCFLHSYDYKLDRDGSLLTIILTAPMVVAQWINMQYLFSTIDNVAYGGGSKVTKNIIGKIGVMQGNASDLMTGLPLQSVNMSDTESYHELQRLMTVVYAPRQMLEIIVHTNPVLKKLFGNGWVQLASIDPDSRTVYLLNRDFTWKKIH